MYDPIAEARACNPFELQMIICNILLYGDENQERHPRECLQAAIVALREKVKPERFARFVENICKNYDVEKWLDSSFLEPIPFEEVTR